MGQVRDSQRRGQDALGTAGKMPPLLGALQVSLYFLITTIQVTLGHFKADTRAFLPCRPGLIGRVLSLKQTPTTAGAGFLLLEACDFLHNQTRSIKSGLFLLQR